MLSLLKRLRPARLLVLAATAACGGGGDGGGGTTPPPPPPTPAIALSLSATATTLQAGGNTTFTANLARTNFTGAVTVSVGGAPTGVTSTVTNSGDVYTIALSTVATAAAGTYPLTITAAGSGVSNATATYTLTLTAPPAASYTLAVTPAALTVQQGQSGNATVNITRTNFTGAVGLAVTGAPAGVTPTLGAASVTGDNTTLAVAVATTVAAGNYTLTVTGTATGQANRTATLTLTVTAAPATGSIALAAAPATLNATAGGAAVTSTVTITRTNFAGDVTLAAAPLPAGATASFTPATTAGTSSVLTLTFGAAVTPGTYPITITGTGNGIASASTQVSVTVAAAPPTGSISITAGNNTIQAGASGSINVFVTRTNFTGDVTLVATGMPNGVTTTYTQPGAGNSGQVTFAVGASVAAGNYPITVTASGTGVANATATGTLTVTAAPSGGGNVTMNFCGTQLPIWLAAQNGNGAWTQVNAGANNSYSFNITSTGAAAWVEQSGADQFTLNLVYGNATELNQRGNCGTLTPSNRTATGTVAGFGSSLASFISVSFGGASPTTQPTAAAPNFTINNIPTGALDLLASRAALNLTNASITVDKLFLRRNLNPPNGGSLGTVDFNGADAFDPDTRTVAIGGAIAGETIGATTLFSTASGSSILLGFGTSGTGGSATFNTFPSARTIAGDMHLVAASATQSAGSIPVAVRTVSTWARDPNNLNVTLGQALNTPTASSTNGAYARVRFTLARQSDYANLWAAGFSQGGGNTQRSANFTVFASAAAAGTVTMEVPDFSGVAGWQNLWGPRVGTQGTWSVSANGWVIGNGNNAEGTVVRTGQRFGNLTP